MAQPHGQHRLLAKLLTCFTMPAVSEPQHGVQQNEDDTCGAHHVSSSLAHAAPCQQPATPEKTATAPYQRQATPSELMQADSTCPVTPASRRTTTAQGSGSLTPTVPASPLPPAVPAGNVTVACGRVSSWRRGGTSASGDVQNDDDDGLPHALFHTQPQPVNTWWVRHGTYDDLVSNCRSSRVLTRSGRPSYSADGPAPPAISAAVVAAMVHHANSTPCLNGSVTSMVSHSRVSHLAPSGTVPHPHHAHHHSMSGSAWMDTHLPAGQVPWSRGGTQASSGDWALQTGVMEAALSCDALQSPRWNPSPTTSRVISRAHTPVCEPLPTTTTTTTARAVFTADQI